MKMNMQYILGTACIACGIGAICVGCLWIREERLRLAAMRTETAPGSGKIVELPVTSAFNQSTDASITTQVGLYLSDPDLAMSLQVHSIEMPCGNKMLIKKWKRFPAHDIPCPCGNPKHWLFKRGPITL